VATIAGEWRPVHAMTKSMTAAAESMAAAGLRRMRA
jgi:hypothetical protein